MVVGRGVVRRGGVRRGGGRRGARRGSSWRRQVVAGVLAFTAMEPVSYASHRWLMHGPGWGLHESHHQARSQGPEANDWYPVGLAAATVVGMGIAARRGWREVLAAGVGVTAYGTAYAVVHEVYAHRRIPALRRRSPLLETLGQRHLVHHRRGGEPFGMLAPLVLDRRPTPSPAAGDPLVEVRSL